MYCSHLSMWRHTVPLPPPILNKIADFMDFLPGIPWSDSLAKEFANQFHTLKKDKNWKVVHHVHRRSVRENNVKKTVTSQEIEIFVYDKDKVMPAWIQAHHSTNEALKENERYVLAKSLQGQDKDILGLMQEAHKIVARIEAGEVCSCKKKNKALCRESTRM